MKTKYLSGILAVALGAIAMTSCNDDDTYDIVGNPNNLVYVNIAGDFPEGMPKNSFAYVIYHTPIGPVVSEEPGEIEIDVMCTKNVPSDMEVTLEVAPNMAVPGYSVLPSNSGIKVTLESNTLTIPAGGNRSTNKVKANVDVTNANWEALTEKAYLVPIRIASASGAQPSQSMVGAAYVGVLTDVKTGMLNTGASRVDGTLITETDGWTGTWKAPGAGKEGTLNAKAFDNNRGTYPYFVRNHADGVNEELITTIDLGKVYKLKGVGFRYYYNWYTIKDGKLETSLDGVEYTEQGTCTWSDNSYDYRAFAFWGPMDVRYVRLTSHSFYGGTGEGTAFSDFLAFE